MDTITHALLPVIAAHGVFRHASWLKRRYGLIAIGIAGALPDLLNPHLSLESRMASWSHGLPFWGVLTGLLFLVSFLSRGWLDVRLALLLSGAYILHLFCDAVSGGINWFYPLGQYVWGSYWVPAILWIPLDIVCLLCCYYLFRLKPLWDRNKQAALSRNKYEIR